MRLRFLLAALCGVNTWVSAQTPPAVTAVAAATAAAPLARDLREDVQQLTVTVKNMAGTDVTGAMTLTTYRPAGEGPFPLVVMNHGRAVAERRAQQGRQRYEPLARYLVSKGFAVMVPTRLGYGDTYGHFDPEAAGRCASLQIDSMSQATSDQVLAAVAHARTLPWVDATRWVVMGQSVGGLAAVAVAWRNPPGLVAAINLAGGAGGNPESRPGDPCSPQVTEALWRRKAADASVPMLWLYWANDRYWGAEWPQRWARAWQDGGGRVEFHQLPAIGADGHSGMSLDMDRWVPIVEAYLARAGFAQSGVVARPAATDFAALDDIDKLPAGRNARISYQTRFLAAKPPRAFALGSDGNFGWATGDWAAGRALGFCQSARGLACKLYALDDTVVWAP